MSIIQALIGSIVSSGSGGGGGGGQSYPATGVNYLAQGPAGFSINGTPYDPGGAVDAIYAPSAGWRRVTADGTWSVSGGNDNPTLFNSVAQVDVDAWGGFGYTNSSASYYAMEWKGYIKAGPGSYHNFYTDSDDVCMFWIGNAALNPTLENAYVVSNGGTTYPTNSLLLTEDKWYPIRMRFQEWDGAENCQVFYASEGNTAYGMLTYFNANRLQFSAEWNGHGSTNSTILHLGSASTNVYSGSGNWLDSSPALNHAVPVGVTAPTWLASDSGGVWQLNGANWFSIPTLPYYNEKAMSYSIWFNCTADNTASQDLIAEELSFKLRLNPGGVINVMVGPGYGSWLVNVTPAITYTYGTWANITATITDSGISVYLNAFNLGDYSGISHVGSVDDFPFNIGCHNGDGSDAFVGKIGEVKIYTYGLTAQEVSDHYTATVARYIPPGPITAYVSGWNLTSNFLSPDVAGNPDLTPVVAGWTVTGPADFTATVVGTTFSNGTNWVIPVDTSLAGFDSQVNTGNYTFTPPL